MIFPQRAEVIFLQRLYYRCFITINWFGECQTFFLVKLQVLSNVRFSTCTYKIIKQKNGSPFQSVSYSI